MRGELALRKLLAQQIDGYILDIGSGHGEHAMAMEAAGFDVMTVDPVCAASLETEWPNKDIVYDEQPGAIWCCHTLEHSRNPGAFLDACFAALKDGGWLAITVPPAKHQIVSGHVSIWNAGLLLYHLVLAGFDCSEAMVLRYDYNISVVVRKKAATLPELTSGYNDLNSLSSFFPVPVMNDTFDGNFEAANW